MAVQDLDLRMARFREQVETAPAEKDKLTHVLTDAVTGSFASMIRRASASTWAAPPMSFFITRIPAAGFRFRPPVSSG